MYVHTQVEAESKLVVVSSTGFIMPWSVADLPHTPDEEGLALDHQVEAFTVEEEEKGQVGVDANQAPSVRPSSRLGGQEEEKLSGVGVHEGEEEEEEEEARPTAPVPTVISGGAYRPGHGAAEEGEVEPAAAEEEDYDMIEEPRRLPPPQPLPIPFEHKVMPEPFTTNICPPPSGGPVVMPTYRDRKPIRSAVSGQRGRVCDLESAKPPSVGGWLLCHLNRPSVNSTAILRDELMKAQMEKFSIDDAAISDTSSVIEDAARVCIRAQVIFSSAES